MRQAVAAHNASSDRKLERDHGPAARLPLTGELTMQIVDQTVDALDVVRPHPCRAGRPRAGVGLPSRIPQPHPRLGGRLSGGTGPQIGIRETRHIVGREAVTGDDVLAGRRRPDDGIARCGWPMEEHQGVGSTKYTPIDGRAFYDIPLLALQLD